MTSPNQKLAAGEFFGQPVQCSAAKQFTFCEYRYPPGFAVPTHSHAEGLISLLVRGSYTERCGTRVREDPPGVVYHHPGEEHSEIFGPRGARLFGFSVPNEVSETLQACGAKIFDSHENFGAFGTTLVLRIRRAVRERSGIGLLAAEALAMELLCGLPCRQLAKSERRVPSWLRPVRDLLDSEQGLFSSLSVISAQVGLHPSYVAREFRKWQGCSIGQYIADRRVAWSIEKIRYSGHSLAFIAEQAGFADQSHLTRVVKCKSGLTPASFRKQARSQKHSNRS